MSSNSLSGRGAAQSSLTSAPRYRHPSYATIAAGGVTDSPNSPGRRPSTAMAGRDGRSDSSRSIPSVTAPPPPPHHQELGSAHERWLGTSNGPIGAGWASDSARYGIDRLTCHDDYPIFFTPSYLRFSRHMYKLGHAYDEFVAHLDEQASRQGQRQPPLSTSSSNANLNKMNSYRAPIQDVIERLPPSSEYDDRLHPLPSRWADNDKMNGLEIIADGTEVRFNGVTKTSDEAAAVRSDFPMPKECGIYYFEVTILSRGKDGLIGVGFSSRKANLNRLPGWESESWAYHGDDGYVFACTASGKPYGPRFAAPDVIGCGVNFRTGNAFFTRNGHNLGSAFNGIRHEKLYPSVGMKKPGEHLRINFGKTPFVFDIDGMVERERQTILAEISKADVSTLHPPDDENALVQHLIGQYLAHEGYVETAKAFAKDVHDREQSLSIGSTSAQLSNESDDIHANNRQKIRKSILDGDIDKALKYTTTYYPRLFEDDKNKETYFKLRCRKFIEMMRRYTELGTAVSSPMTVTKSVESIESNGHKNGANEEQELDEPPDTQMELDDQLHRETSKGLELLNDDVDMDASQELSPKLSYMKADQLLSHTLAYGQELQAEFGKDPRPETQRRLQDIFASVAYTNLTQSPLSYLFDPQGRLEIAEAVNGAILVSLGKPSSAALEKLCAQTETLLDETALKNGGAAALINVRKDFLQE